MKEVNIHFDEPLPFQRLITFLILLSSLMFPLNMEWEYLNTIHLSTLHDPSLNINIHVTIP